MALLRDRRSTGAYRGQSSVLVRPYRLLPTVYYYVWTVQIWLFVAQFLTSLVGGAVLIIITALWMSGLLTLDFDSFEPIEPGPIPWIAVAILVIDFLDTGARSWYIVVNSGNTLLRHIMGATEKLYGIRARIRHPRRYKSFRLGLALLEAGGGTALLFCVVYLAPFDNQEWTSTGNPSIYCLFGIMMTRLMSTALGLLASSESLATLIYKSGKGVDVVDFRFLLQRRSVLEQSYHWTLDHTPRPLQGEIAYAPRATILPKEKLDLDSNLTNEVAVNNKLTLFMRCNCCLELGSMIPPRSLSRSSKQEKSRGGEIKHEQKVKEWMIGREQIMNPGSRYSQELPERDRQDPRRGRHRLCQTCRYFVFNLHHLIWREHSTNRRDFWNAVKKAYSVSPRDFQVLEHAASPRELERSSTHCHFCSIIWNALSPGQKQQILDHDEQLCRQAANDDAGGAELHKKRHIRVAVSNEEVMIVHYGSFNRPRRWLEVPRGHNVEGIETLMKTQLMSEDAPFISLFSSPGFDTKLVTLPKQVGPDLAITLISSWLQGLEMTQAQPSTWMPTRVLDVSADDSPIVRVVRSDDILGDRRYVALSHCWGLEHFLTYTVDTAGEFHQGIAISKLARTFRESINLVRRLKIRYLWIDSLCIMQKRIGVGRDDEAAEDWETEAPTMSRVYMSAYFTVVATSSWGAAEGLYRDYSSLPTSRCFLTGRAARYANDANCEAGTEDYQVEALCAEALRDPNEGTSAMNDVQWSKWRSRGWTLQEQILSPRIVHFTDKSLAFETKDVMQGQISDQTLLPEDLGEWLAFQEDRTSSQHAKAGNSPWHFPWWGWVSQFTCRRLSEPDDRAVAILGLAQYLATCKAFRRPRKCRYLAGLWEPTLVSDLLWCVSIGIAKWPSTCRAPSWSWISVDGGIENSLPSAFYKTGVIVEKIVAHPATALADVSPSADGDTNQPIPRLAQGSFIQLNGVLRTLTWRKWLDDEDQVPYYYSHNDRLNETRRPDLLTNAALGVLPCATTQRNGPQCYPIFVEGCTEHVGWFVPDTIDVLQDPAELYCLRINIEPVAPEYRVNFTIPWVIRGIALQPTQSLNEDAEIPSYTRVGFFELAKQSRGVYLPMDACYMSAITRHIHRVPPDTDPYGVFRDRSPQSIRIY